MNEVVRDVLLVAVILPLYYGVVLVLVRDRLVATAVRFLLGHFRNPRHPVGDLENVIMLIFSVTLQILLFFLLAAWTAAELGQVWRSSGQPQLLAYGAVLGAGEMLLSSFLGLILIKISTAFPQVGNPLVHWRIVINSGWMRLFNTTVKLLPLPAAIAVVVLYVGVEELIIRGIVVNAFLPLGPVTAVVLSTAVFAGYQVFNLPSWRVALFPVLGALVIGPVHGALYVTIPDVWPLVVAHVTYFTIVALTFR
jgi:membrane protease YdiL (CAAX protease family)